MSVEAAPAVLQATAVDYSARGHAILHGVDVALRPGEVTVIIGPNGAGKSTLLALLGGEHPASSGTVELHGRPARAWKSAEAARLRAVMEQDSAVSFPFTVREVVEMGRTAWRRTAEEHDDDAAVGHAMATTGVARLGDRPVTSLSGGERQRTALARVLAQLGPSPERRVVLLDEPISAMDIAHQEATLRTCRELAAAGVAVAVVLHDLDAAAAYADRMLLLANGRVVRDGTVPEVADATLLSEVYGTPIEVFRTEAGGRLRVAPRR